MINRYINKIRKDKKNVYDHSGGHEAEEYTFIGDGQGDFEEYSDSATKECILDYIRTCEEQKRIACEYLSHVFGVGKEEYVETFYEQASKEKLIEEHRHIRYVYSMLLDSAREERNKTKEQIKKELIDNMIDAEGLRKMTVQQLMDFLIEYD